MFFISRYTEKQRLEFREICAVKMKQRRKYLYAIISSGCDLSNQDKGAKKRRFSYGYF